MQRRVWLRLCNKCLNVERREERRRDTVKVGAVILLFKKDDRNNYRCVIAGPV